MLLSLYVYSILKQDILQCLNVNVSWGHGAMWNEPIQSSPVQSLSHVSLRPHGLQNARLSCPSPTSRVYSNPCPLSQWCHPTISSCHPLLLLPSILPSIRVLSITISSHQLAKVLEFQLQHQSFQWISNYTKTNTAWFYLYEVSKRVKFGNSWQFSG